MTGPKKLMVTKNSAERISHDVRGIDHLPSNTDHRGLVRFEHAQDARYRSVVDKLRSMAIEAARRNMRHQLSMAAPNIASEFSKSMASDTPALCNSSHRT